MHIFKPLWETSRGKLEFVKAIPVNGCVLDVGCGNNSPAWFKSVRPDLYYVGLDVGEYNQAIDPKKYADEYVICSSNEFAAAIERYVNKMDAVVSSHNLEHCDEPERVLVAMVNALKSGGNLYVSFPCEESVKFPRRAGSLNFFDDASHKAPPSWHRTLEAIENSGCRIQYRIKRHRPFPLWLKGLFVEPVSFFRREAYWDGSTWALYGFESVIWATRK